MRGDAGTLLSEFWALAGEPVPSVGITARDDVLPSALDTTELAVGSVAAAGTAATTLAEARGHPSVPAHVDGRRVSAAFRSDQLFRLDGKGGDGFAPLSGFFRAADGWIRTHANYAHHRDRLLRALELPESAAPDDLAAIVRELPATEAERRITESDGVAAAVRSGAGWREQPQAEAIQRLPLVGWNDLGPASPRRLPPLSTDPLLPAAGIRVLDLTRVIAGPVATRTLALLGADVLRVDTPRLPEIAWQHLDTGMGKRSTLLDLLEPGDRSTFEHLLDEADVVVMGYRPQALAAFGLDPDALAARRPGIVVAQLSAWGPIGPWGSRRGFDSIVQAASGIALAESPDGETPGRLPAQALDHATGYLLAAGVLVALTRQMRRGGSWYVHAHLARTAQWLLDHPVTRRGTMPAAESVLRERSSLSGLLRYPLPAVQFDGGPDDWGEVGRPWGEDAPMWESQPAADNHSRT